LRRLASPLKWTEAWHWAIGGAGVFLLVLYVLSMLGAGFYRVAAGSRIEPLGKYLFSQAADSLHGGVWQALAAGALTALMLFAVNRAFTREYPVQNKEV
jgi:ABC-type Fe3+ transport system permease subunit